MLAHLYAGPDKRGAYDEKGVTGEYERSGVKWSYAAAYGKPSHTGRRYWRSPARTTSPPSSSSPFAFVNHAHRRHPRLLAPPVIGLVTTATHSPPRLPSDPSCLSFPSLHSDAPPRTLCLRSQPRSIDAVSHSTQPRLRSQRWILCGSDVFDVHCPPFLANCTILHLAYVYSPPPCAFTFLSLWASCLHLLALCSLRVPFFLSSLSLSPSALP